MRRRGGVTAALGAVSLGFFAFAVSAPKPWEGEARDRIAQRLGVEDDAIPAGIYRDFEALGGLNLGTPAFRQVGLWYGAWFAAAAFGIGALTARWWFPRTEGPGGEDAVAPVRSLPRSRRTDLGLLGLALLLAIGARAPHLNRAIYFDEQDNLRRNFHGYVEVREDGQRVWRPAGWSEALWENRLGNNPVLMSLCAQASLRTWRAVTGAEREHFNIVALRTPVFLAGLLSIAAVWWLLQLWGFRWAAAFAAFLTAVHPMHIDYSLQARGYALVLLFVPVALGFAWLAMKRGRWLDWAGMAAAVFGCLWSYTGSVYFALALNGGMLTYLLWRRFRKKEAVAGVKAARLLAVNAASATVYLFLMAPSVPQLAYHFRNVFELIELEFFWLFYAWSHYSTGTNFPLHHDVLELRQGVASLGEVLFGRFAPSEPVLIFMQWIVIPAVIVTAFVLLRRRGHRLPAALLLLAMLAPFLALAHHQFTSLYFYYWYLSYALPAVVATFAAGLEMIFSPLLRRRTSGARALVTAVALAYLGVFVWQTWHGLGRSGRVAQSRAWPLNEEGLATVEFRRGRSHWIVYRDGRVECLKDVYDPVTGVRAGREAKEEPAEAPSPSPPKT
ncbi:MAG: glycosyltransferase family 39 protein [Akkermansiaceae bacterium]|nr:glycosyltransferase family 39 protein [Akkermansiaceae bacterium]MCP5551923.1 glycosyltransferase family 39 protein [Akkermansiaceae bacterium]